MATINGYSGHAGEDFLIQWATALKPQVQKVFIVHGEPASANTLADALKATCFLKSMGDFGKFNGIYAGYFGETPPARETVEVARLPRHVLGTTAERDRGGQQQH